MHLCTYVNLARYHVTFKIKIERIFNSNKIIQNDNNLGVVKQY